MEKKYISPEIKMVKFDVMDIIQTSTVTVPSSFEGAVQAPDTNSSSILSE